MSSVEGSLAFAIVLGIAVALAMAAGRRVTDELLERKGFIGLTVAGVIAGCLLWLNARIIADYLGVSTSEVQLFAIIIFVTLILVIVWRNRETTERTARTSTRVARITKRGLQKARKK